MVTATARARFPQVEIVLREMTTMQQVQALQKGSIHLGMLRPPIPEIGLNLQIVRQEPFVVVLPPTTRFAPDERLSLSTLSVEPFVLFPRVISPGVYDQVISLFNQAGFSGSITKYAIL